MDASLEPTLAVCGSINADLRMTCDELPGPGETVLARDTRWSLGGKGANQAVAAARSGLRVAMHGAVGRDAHGDAAVEDLEANGVDAQHVRRVDSPTTVAVVMVDARGENQIVVGRGANDLVAPDADALAQADAVLCQLETSDEVLTLAARSTRGLFCLNAAPARPIPREAFDRLDLLIVNDGEFEALGRPDAAAVAVTHGARGATLLRRGRSVASAAPPPVEAVDTVGAGDAFVAALIAAFLRGLDDQAAVEHACEVAAAVVQRTGAR